MIFGKEKAIKREMVQAGKRLYQTGLAVAKSGNISARLGPENILITATGTSLGNLKHKDIVKVNLSSLKTCGTIQPSSELPLHSLVYKNFKARVVLHCHPPLINGYFAVASDLKILTFESKLYLGKVPVVPQETPAVTNPEAVIEALRTSNLAALKNHGVVAIGENFEQALHLIENLEEAVRSAAVARLFKKDLLDDLDKPLRENLAAQTIYPMFSQGHIQAIVDLVNQDEFIKRKGEELDLTLQLAIKLDETGQAYKFTFEKGRITGLEPDANASFVISAPAQVWELVFLGRLDSFVAVTQGRMKLKGELAKLSRWYVPFSRLFELFKQVKIRR
ncbi:MAG: class II aldolase/adducin family protein [Candidatus Omnitrophica bacterium]|nr:class II aldolase/adducin family protein [Candidatus Omnitrophota bacterium]